jgi:hypothetical protein
VFEEESRVVGKFKVVRFLNENYLIKQNAQNINIKAKCILFGQHSFPEIIRPIEWPPYICPWKKSLFMLATYS